MTVIDVQQKYLLAEQLYEEDQVDEAEILFRELAELGHFDSCVFLAYLYRADERKKSPKLMKYWNREKIKILEKLSNRGDTNAMLLLGRCYQYGDGIESNGKKAFIFIEQAAKKGNAEAQFHLSNIYRFGWCDVTSDSNALIKWLLAAAKQKHPEAMYLIGLTKIDQDDAADGLKWIHAAADAGFWVAQEYMAKISK